RLAEEATVANSFILQSPKKLFCQQLTFKKSAKSFFVMELYCSLVQQRLLKSNPSASSSVPQERVQRCTVTSNQRRHVSRTSAERKDKLHSASATRSEEMQLLHDLKSCFTKLNSAEKKLVKSLKSLLETHDHHASETTEKGEDVTSMLERKMKTAAIPPPLSDVTVQPICYYHVKDPMKIWKVEDRTSQGFNEEEKTEFRKRFKQYSKSFDAAACFLLNKSASDCVKYYNFNKHAEDLVAIKKGKKPAHRKAEVPDL
ncbi:hypothetical protein M514_22648, partial [Trichuris suis]